MADDTGGTEGTEGTAEVPGDLAAAERQFSAVRRQLFGIAYRILGSAAEADDVLQDAWVRWQTCDRSAVRNPAAFLTTTTTRLAINVAQSARVRRETYVGPWLPEPVDTSADPTLGAERGEVLEVAILMLLERLTPTERAAYVLREAFDYPYARIAEVIGHSQASVRQLVSRARRHLGEERRAPVAPQAQRTLLTAFVAAAKVGDVAVLERLFAEDVVSYSDGGGVVRASKFPVVGRERVAKYVHAFASHFWVGVDVEPADVNGGAAALLSRDGTVFAVLTVRAAVDGIDRVLWMMNPKKLAPLTS
ncbi:RNA polymerase sigma-70 factor [Cellulosimicrobium sp. Marseille-Q8652]